MQNNATQKKKTKRGGKSITPLDLPHPNPKKDIKIKNNIEKQHSATIDATTTSFLHHHSTHHPFFSFSFKNATTKAYPPPPSHSLSFLFFPAHPPHVFYRTERRGRRRRHPNTVIPLNFLPPPHTFLSSPSSSSSLFSLDKPRKRQSHPTTPDHTSARRKGIALTESKKKRECESENYEG